MYPFPTPKRRAEHQCRESPEGVSWKGEVSKAYFLQLQVHLVRYVNGSYWKLEAECVTYPQSQLGTEGPQAKKIHQVFNRYLLSISYVPGTVTRTEDTVNKTQVSAVAVLHSRRGDN